jgi:hypothetical protein
LGLERGTLRLVSTTEELLDRKVAALVYKTDNTAVGIRNTDNVAPSIRQKVGTNFTDNRRSLGRIIRSQTQATEFFLICSSVPHLFTRNLTFVDYISRATDEALRNMSRYYGTHNNSANVLW